MKTKLSFKQSIYAVLLGTVVLVHTFPKKCFGFVGQSATVLKKGDFQVGAFGVLPLSPFALGGAVSGIYGLGASTSVEVQLGGTTAGFLAGGIGKYQLLNTAAFDISARGGGELFGSQFSVPIGALFGFRVGTIGLYAELTPRVIITPKFSFGMSLTPGILVGLTQSLRLVGEVQAGIVNVSHVATAGLRWSL